MNSQFKVIHKQLVANEFKKEMLAR